jgi:hypothetical protein
MIVKIEKKKTLDAEINKKKKPGRGKTCRAENG